jgi:prolipoprotein diacylglyceryltransferase
MLYEAFLYVALFAILWTIYLRYKGKPPEGFIFGVFLIIMFTGRFLLEYTKVEQAEFATDWFIGMGQILSVPFVILGVWLLWKKVKW